MKLTKKLMMAAVVAFVAQGAFAVAVDSYLYWMVDSEILNSSSQAVTWDYVKVSYGDGDHYLSLYKDGVDTGITALDYDPATAGVANGWWGVFNYSEGSEFLFELYRDDILVGTQNESWESMLAHISQGAASTATGATPYVLSGVNAIPEPTSGLLSLFGLAALALRRRRRA